ASPSSSPFPYPTLFRSSLRGSPLNALRRFNDPSIGAALTAAYKDFPAALQTPARQVLLSRGAWARDFLLLVDSGELAVDEVPVRSEEHTSELQSREHII